MEQEKKEEKAKTSLHAICYEYRVGRGRHTRWIPEIDYLHAVDVADARLQYLQSEPPQVMREVRIVAVSRVIGYFVDDNKGDSLSV